MDEARQVVMALRQAGQTVATAESCTGGLIGKRLTDISGSSNVYPGGVISYAYEVKQALLGVDGDLLREKGAVCAEVAKQMAEGVRSRLGTDYGLASTGIAGPGSDEFDRPVGLVYLAVAGGNVTRVYEHRFSGTRAAVRRQAASMALEHLLEHILQRSDADLRYRQQQTE